MTRWRGTMSRETSEARFIAFRDGTDGLRNSPLAVPGPYIVQHGYGHMLFVPPGIALSGTCHHDNDNTEKNP